MDFTSYFINLLPLIGAVFGKFRTKELNCATQDDIFVQCQCDMSQEVSVHYKYPFELDHVLMIVPDTGQPYMEVKSFKTEYNGSDASRIYNCNLGLIPKGKYFLKVKPYDPQEEYDGNTFYSKVFLVPHMNKTAPDVKLPRGNEWSMNYVLQHTYSHGPVVIFSFEQADNRFCFTDYDVTLMANRTSDQFDTLMTKTIHYNPKKKKLKVIVQDLDSKCITYKITVDAIGGVCLQQRCTRSGTNFFTVNAASGTEQPIKVPRDVMEMGHTHIFDFSASKPGAFIAGFLGITLLCFIVIYVVRKCKNRNPKEENSEPHLVQMETIPQTRLADPSKMYIHVSFDWKYEKIAKALVNLLQSSGFNVLSLFDIGFQNRMQTSTAFLNSITTLQTYNGLPKKHMILTSAKDAHNEPMEDGSNFEATLEHKITMSTMTNRYEENFEQEQQVNASTIVLTVDDEPVNTRLCPGIRYSLSRRMYEVYEFLYEVKLVNTLDCPWNEGSQDEAVNNLYRTIYEVPLQSV